MPKMLHWIKSTIPKRTHMIRIGRMFTDFPIRVNPRHPCNSCSIAASLFAEAPEIRNVNYLKFAQAINLRSSMPKPCGFSTPRTRMPRRAYRAAISTYGGEPYVCATSTGATVDVDTPSRGVTLGAFICGSIFDNDRCEHLPHTHLPKFDVFAAFAFSKVSRLTPQSTPRAQSLHELITKVTEMTKMTRKEGGD